MQTRKPKVSLISFTQDCIPLMCFFKRIQMAPVPDTLEELMVFDKKWLDGLTINEYFERVLCLDHGATFMEAVSLTFKCDNVSRAFTHQLVRHRIGFGYSQQSMRVVRAEGFADEGAYHVPSTVKDPVAFHTAMRTIQTSYQLLLDYGESTQDARGILPTNVQTSINFTCSLKALIGMVNQRLCLKVQDEFAEVARHIEDLVIRNLDPRLERFFGAPCQIRGVCQIQAECEKQFLEGKLTGADNTSKCCPLYVAKRDQLMKGE